MLAESFCDRFGPRSTMIFPDRRVTVAALQFTCKNCGSKSFKGRRPKSLNDIVGAVCSQCGTVISKDDIVAQVRAMSGDRAEDLLRKAGFK
jgi:transcription elongation factor Elf1